jgi:voltage-gated potassium channel
MASLREVLSDMLSDRVGSRPAAAYRIVEIVIVVGGLMAMMMATTDRLGPGGREIALRFMAAGMICLAADWVLRLWLAPASFPQLTHHKARLRWLHSLPSLVGIVAVVPMALGALVDWSPDGAPLCAVLWVLRFAHYSRGMSMLFDVLAREREAVLGVLFAFVALLLFSSVLGYLVERDVQPDKFGSVPHALWWAIVTLTTTGYGDVVPQTTFGRMLAGLMMIAGIIVFGLLAGILATGFSLEVRRREFLRNWDLVKHVPMFRDLGPGTIADLAALLRPREVPPRAVLWRRGDRGSTMYFIVSGEVAILIEPPLRLAAGDFFGELALLNNRPRNATVVTTQTCQLLELDIADFRSLASKTPDLMRSIEREGERRLASERAGSPT